MSSESPRSNGSPSKPDDEGAVETSAEEKTLGDSSTAREESEQADAHADSVDSDVIELDAEPDSVHPPPPPSLRPRTETTAKKEPLGLTATAKLPAPAWPPKVVADLMTRKIITVGQDEPIGNLEAGMQHFGFHHLPVVGPDMKLVGLISLTDLLHAQLGTTPDGKPAPTIDANTPARAIMRKNVVIARLDSPVSAACQVLLQKKLTCLPVALENGTLVGILTQRDFLKLALALLENTG
jgi:CBS domain-containing protein